MLVAAPAVSVPPLRRRGPLPENEVAWSMVNRPELICTAPGPASANEPLIRLLAEPSAFRKSVVPSATAMRPPVAEVRAATPLLLPL